MNETLFKHLDDIDGVVFDFGGVVSYAPDGSWPVYAFCEKFGIPSAVVEACNAKFRRLTDIGDITMEDFYRRVAAEAGVAIADPAFFREAAAKDSEGWAELAPETLALMRTLKARGKKLGILSNMSRLFYEEYFTKRAAEVAALCESKTISWRVHLLKPDPAIYDLSARDMGIAPERLLFLDDTPGNVEAARRCGWRSEVYVVARPRGNGNG
jgi:HAD superfamily hydrolase (TIGR01509 family)